MSITWQYIIIIFDCGISSAKSGQAVLTGSNTPDPRVYKCSLVRANWLKTSKMKKFPMYGRQIYSWIYIANASQKFICTI